MAVVCSYTSMIPSLEVCRLVSILYDIVIQPLIYMIELVFLVGCRLTGSEGLAIVGVSLAVNLLCLPLYRMADAAQDSERMRQASMKRWVDHINDTFHGDERTMMLQSYYRLKHYHPAQALVASLSLLLQIPFFMAAYSYLSSLRLLHGSTFLLLSNLGKPDALLALGGLSVNVLPVLMTVINFFSTVIYTRGLPLRDKIQAYGLGLVFLVLLYDSPSGLVFYWVCNQIFSLGKNVFMKLVPEPRPWALRLVQISVLLFSVWFISMGYVTTPKSIVVSIAALASFEVLWFRAWRNRPEDDSHVIEQDSSERRRTIWQFIAGGALLSILLGTFIPSTLIGDSPTEFMVGINSPLRYMFHTTFVWIGVFLFWWGTYFVLSNATARKQHTLVVWLLCGVCLLDHFFFGRNLGTITTMLVYDAGVQYSMREQLINISVLVAMVMILYFIWNHYEQVVLPIMCVTILSLSILSMLNARAIAAAVAEETKAREDARGDLVLPDGSPQQILHLSQSEQNVVVIFLDRAISSYLPYIMAERPELKAQFDGFTYYPNTLSHGWYTNFGAPGLYGGYEYVPAAMNSRPNESLQDKHNEAILVMPTLMSSAGYRTTVVDPPYAGNYTWDGDLSIYEGLPNTEAYNIDGAYTDYVKDKLGISTNSDLNRKFVYYSVLRTVPELLQSRIYDGGRYLAAEGDVYPKQTMIDQLSVLEVLPEMTDTRSTSGGFILLGNNTTHEEDYLQLPDYEIAQVVNNTGLEDWSRFELNGISLKGMSNDFPLMHYHVNAAALIRLGTWFDWMRKKGIWDNTRVIVVSDHGRNLAVLDDLIIDKDLDVMQVNPLLMVKDFDSKGFKVSDEFMTNADTPTMAMEGVVDNPVNPFTNTPINNEEKTQHDQLVTLSWNYNVEINRGNVFNTSDAPWYSVHDDIFDHSNWTRYETYEDAIEAVPQ